MNADQVLIDHHDVLRGLCKKITATPAEAAERQHHIDELLVELDIHMRIEDELFYPAVSAASELVAIAHAEHCQVSDRLAVFLGTAPADPGYEGEWQAFRHDEALAHEEQSRTRVRARARTRRGTRPSSRVLPAFTNQK